LALDWHTVKALEMQYMKAQLARAGTPGPVWSKNWNGGRTSSSQRVGKLTGRVSWDDGS